MLTTTKKEKEKRSYNYYSILWWISGEEGHNRVSFHKVKIKKKKSENFKSNENMYA